ncbi:hypothetical protein [Rhizorhabdus histidinilytica]|uniref:hypothetical protein n=1 Tax=Rhizorhabdus histidinilytica TaxID=439228 RepID=UPI00040CDD1F
MTTLTPALDTAFSAPQVTIFGAVQIALPDHDINLLDGSAELTIDGDRYTGRDDIYGTLESIEDLTEGIGAEAPRLSMTLLPASDAAAATLASASMQGSVVSIRVGAVDPMSGQPIPDPFVAFIGELDVPTLNLDAGRRTLDYEAASIWERFFSDDEGIRLSPGWHKSVWPGELGMDFVTGIQERVYWGVKRPQGAFNYVTTGFLVEMLKRKIES